MAAKKKQPSAKDTALETQHLKNQSPEKQIVDYAHRERFTRAASNLRDEREKHASLPMEPTVLEKKQPQAKEHQQF